MWQVESKTKLSTKVKSFSTHRMESIFQFPFHFSHFLLVFLRREVTQTPHTKSPALSVEKRWTWTYSLHREGRGLCVLCFLLKQNRGRYTDMRESCSTDGPGPDSSAQRPGSGSQDRAESWCHTQHTPNMLAAGLVKGDCVGVTVRCTLTLCSQIRKPFLFSLLACLLNTRCYYLKVNMTCCW